MTGSDFPAFKECFSVLLNSGLRGIPRIDGREGALAAYFQALERYPFRSVELGYESLQRSATYWPSVAQWIAAMPRSRQAIADMTAAQMALSDEAEQCAYEGPRCRCPECVEAGATHLNLRYVPVMHDGEPVHLRHPVKGMLKYLPEIIHGHGLKRWYAARGRFFAMKTELDAAAVAAKLRAPDPRPRLTKLANKGISG